MLETQYVFEFGFLHTSAIEFLGKSDFQRMGTLSPMILQQNKI